MFRKLKQFCDNKFGEYGWYHSFIDDHEFRVIAFTLGGVLINVVFALFNGITALKYSSVWYGVFTGYYVVIALLRMCVLASYRFSRRFCRDDAEKLNRAKAKIYLACGAFLVPLDIALAAVISVMLLQSKPTVTGEIMAITSAAYTTYKTVMAIRNILKARHTSDWLILTIRDIGVVDALASIVTLQTTLISTFGTMDEEMFTLSAIVGLVACAFTIGLGSFMIVKGAHALRLNKQNISNFERDVPAKNVSSGENDGR